MTLSTTIKKIYFDLKLEDLKKDGYFYEYKEEKDFWSKRINKITVDNQEKPKEKIEIVFLVGKNPHRFEVIEIKYTNIIPERYASIIKTEYAYALKCVQIV